MLKYSSWDCYYHDKTNDNGSSGPTSDDTYVFNCYFYNISAGDGSTITFSKPKNNLLIEKCSFFNCTTTNSSGAIRVTGGNSIFVFLCGSHCFSACTDAFSCVSTDQSREINNAIESSVALCKASDRYTMVHNYGSVRINSVNFSHNSANHRSSLYCSPHIGDQEGIETSIKYCSFTNNNSTTEVTIHVTDNTNSNKNNKHEFKNCNIINNRGNNVIWCRGETNFINSCFLENDDPYFYTYDKYSSVTLINSTVDKASDFEQIGSITSFINGLVFISTGYCEQKLIDIGSITIIKPNKENPVDPRNCIIQKCLTWNSYYRISSSKIFRSLQFFLIYSFSMND